MLSLLHFLMAVHLARSIERCGAVHVHAQHLEVDAAVRPSGPAGDTAPAVEVGLDRADVAREDCRHAGSRLQHLDREAQQVS